jgi:membrane associated rhomboid family serine protease
MTFSEKKYHQKISLGQAGNSVMAIIAVSLVLFVLFAFIESICYFNFKDKQTALSFYNKNILSWFTMPASFNKLITRPWTIITHMFIHTNTWKVFANMLWLWTCRAIKK